MKYAPNSDEVDDLYLKFVEFISSKSDRRESDIKNSKHLLPEELINAMAKHITELISDDLSSRTIDIFPPSLTPLYSYLQHLFDHPYYDIPSILRNDFYLTKVGYMTKPDSLIELAMKCDMQLEIIDSNVHFLEKNVPLFEQPRMPSMNELKQLVDVQDDLENQQASESINDYLHAKIPCTIKFNAVKNQYYNSIESTPKSLENIDMGNDFTFTETLPNGKLAIPTDSDDENEEEDSDFINNLDQEKIILGNKFCDKYNLRLSLTEKKSIYTSNVIRSKKLKAQLERNTKGEFVKKSALLTNIEKNSDDVFAVKENVSFYDSPETNEVCIDVETIAKEQLFLNENIDLDGIDIDDIYMKNDFFNISDYFNFSDISIFSKINDVSTSAESKKNNVDNKKYRFFRPFNEYWTYHCIFSRVKSKNFVTFEKELPRTFRWLLNECALMVEMSREDLYEEICLIENYHSQVLKSCNPENNVRSNVNTTTKNQLNFILSKW
ncbi:hypothetical protein WN48_03215 [Eufriesea mexicana]|nr:hypothetical protein WN48_03215 [Eufriesea mexicana]